MNMKQTDGDRKEDGAPFDENAGLPDIKLLRKPRETTLWFSPKTFALLADALLRAANVEQTPEIKK